MATGFSGNRYGKNQFYNINRAEGNIFEGDFNERGTVDNPAFLWPSDTLRNAITGQQTRIQRGYMRLVSEVLGDPKKDATILALGKRRFHFQFNPDTLTRSVTARNDVHMWMNQDPAQFTQPIPGDANFAFEIVLNREAEMASGRYKTGQGLSAERKSAAFLNDFGPSNGTSEELKAIFLERNGDERGSGYDPAWVTDIGVLADLFVFDNIIGQGVNRELIEKMLGRSEYFYNRAQEAAAKQKSEEKNTDEEDKPQETEPFDTDQARKYLSNAIGNSAFLISQPVRVVFSSSFMVEGFITATNVVFNKFNPAMIPTQCTISVQMQAMYIGFAREKTFLTYAYTEAETDIQDALNTSKASATALKDMGANMFKRVADYRVNISPAGFLTLGNGTWKLDGLELEDRSEELENFINDENGTVTANCVVRIFYTKKSDGYNPPSDRQYFINGITPIYQAKASYELTKDGKGVFEFPTQKAEEPKRYDEDGEYRVEVYIDFSAQSNTTATLEHSYQYFSVIKKDVGWGNTKALANDSIPLLRPIPQNVGRTASSAWSSGELPDEIKAVS